MARLKTSSGQLYETTQEEQKNLSKSGSLPVSPITPLGAALTGVNPDQAKMFGTPAQKAPALREALREDQSLDPADLQRKLGPIKDRNIQSGATQLAGLTSLDDRVNQIKERIATTSSVAAQPFDVSKAVGNSSLQAALTKLNKNPQDQAALLQAAQATGMTAKEISSGTLGQALNAQYGASAQTSGPQPTLANFQPADWKALGLTGQSELESALGVKQGSLTGATVPQVQQALSDSIQRHYSPTQQLIAVAQDPFAGEAARADARAQLQGMSAGGLRSAEQAVKKVGQAVQAVTPGLSAEQQATLTGRSQAAISKAAELAKSGGTKLGQTQQAILAQGDLGNGASLDSSVLSALDSNWDKPGLASGGIDSQYKLIKELKSTNIPAQQKVAVASLLSGLVKEKLGSFAKDFAKLSAAEVVKAVGNNPQAYIQKIKDRVVLSGPAFNPLSPPSVQASPDSLAKVFGFSSSSELLKQMQDARIMQQSGLFPGKDSGLAELNNYVQLNSKGQIDVPASLRKMRAILPQASASGLLKDWATPSSLSGKLGSYTDSQSAAFDLVKPVLADGKVTAGEYDKSLKDKVTATNFTTLLPFAKSMPESERAAFAQDIILDTQKFPVVDKPATVIGGHTSESVKQWSKDIKGVVSKLGDELLQATKGSPLELIMKKKIDLIRADLLSKAAATEKKFLAEISAPKKQTLKDILATGSQEGEE
jgi:hypothetical protein